MEIVSVIGHLQPYFKLHLYKRVIKKIIKTPIHKKKSLTEIFLEHGTVNGSHV